MVALTAAPAKGVKLVCALALVTAVAACAGSGNQQRPAAGYDPVPSMPAMPQVPEEPAVPRIEVRLDGSDATLVRGRLATSRRARGYTITVDQPAQLVAEKILSPEEALKRTNGASSDAAFRLDYIFNTSGGAVTVSLEASVVTNPGRPGEVVRPIAMPPADAAALRREISEAN